MDTNKHESMFSHLWRAEFCSPKDFVRRAALISLGFLILHLAGLKDFTSIINGTMGSVELGWGLSAFLELLYIVAWLAFVVLTPMLLLAAALLMIWNRIGAHDSASYAGPESSERTTPERSSRREEALTSVFNK